MLKRRILTALILIPLVIFLVLRLSPAEFCIFTGIVVLLAAWEWCLLLGVSRFPHCLIYPAVIALLLVASLFLPVSYALYPVLIGWILAAVLIFIYPKGQSRWGQSILWRGLMGILVLVPCWLAINFMHASMNGAYMVLFLLALVWTADSAAYFAGKKWGKHKLAPAVSPGKTWEGVAGALFATFLLTVIVLAVFKVPYVQWFCSILLSLVTVVFSIIGDLFESMLKRNEKIKDSGKLFPGHGGLLDRIDSLTAAAPIFALGAIWMGQYFS